MPRPARPAAHTLVRIRAQRWRVLRATPHHASTTLDVVGVGSENRGRRAAFVLPFEPCDAAQVHAAPRRIARRTWRRLVRRTLANAVPAPESLRTAASARFTPLPFQLEPVQAYLRGDAVRLLIADGVGMGKTIQAGLIAAETVARHPNARVLIVVPAALRMQWRDELNARFDLDAAILDAGGLWQLSSCLPIGISPWVACRVAITSIDFVKRPEVLRSLDGLVWDLVVFDEAHALAGRSDRYAAAAGLAARGSAVVLLTATPHSGDHEAFVRLCGLGNLGNRFPLDVFRRERTDLTTSPPRRSRWIGIRPTRAEARLHAQLFDYARRVWKEAATPGAHLAMIVLLKRGASSATALARSLVRRRMLLAELPPSPHAHPLLPFDDADDSEPSSELASPGFISRREECSVLDALIRGATASTAVTRKVLLLQRLLRRTRETALVFTQYRDTLEELHDALARLAPVCLHGGMSPRERMDAMRAFTSGDARVLLATDAASEGLNLHARCRLVVSMDVPWTPVRLEQRIGRVDRIGQTRRVHACQLVAAGTYEDTIAKRVLIRAKAADTVFNAVALEDERATAAEVLTGQATPATAMPWPAPGPEKIAVRQRAAAAEADRIQVARALGEHAAVSVPERPCLATFRGRPARAVAAYRVTYADPSGLCTFDTVVGTTMGWRGNTEDIVVAVMRALPVVTRAVGTATVFHTLRRMTAVTLQRHRAIERALREERARLAGTLLQRELFSNRPGNRATSQMQLLEASVARLRERSIQLRAVRRLSLESVSLVCVATWR